MEAAHELLCFSSSPFEDMKDYELEDYGDETKTAEVMLGTKEARKETKRLTGIEVTDDHKVGFKVKQEVESVEKLARFHEENAKPTLGSFGQFIGFVPEAVMLEVETQLANKGYRPGINCTHGEYNDMLIKTLNVYAENFMIKRPKSVWRGHDQG